VVVDCTAGLAIDENSVKCRQRRAAVYERLGKKRDALNDYLKMPLSDDTDAVIVRLRKELNIQPPPPPSRRPRTPNLTSAKGVKDALRALGSKAGAIAALVEAEKVRKVGRTFPKRQKRTKLA